MRETPATDRALFAVATFGLVARDTGTTLFVVLGISSVVFAGLAFWTASFTALSLLAATIILVLGVAAVRDISVVCRGRSRRTEETHGRRAESARALSAVPR